MKRVLSVALLLSVAQLSAMPFEEAQQKLAHAQDRLAAVQAKIEAESAAASKEHQLTTSIEGKHEYRNDMTSRKAGVRQRIKAHNALVKRELVEANKHLQAALSEVGRFHTIISDGDKYTVVRAENKPLAPIRSAMPVRRARTIS